MCFSCNSVVFGGRSSSPMFYIHFQNMFSSAPILGVSAPVILAGASHASLLYWVGTLRAPCFYIPHVMYQKILVALLGPFPRDPRFPDVRSPVLSNSVE